MPTPCRALAALACFALASPVTRAAEPAPPPAAPAGPAAAPAPQPGQEVVVILKDGQQLRGKLVAQDASGVTIESSGARLQLPAASIEALAAPGSDAAEGPRPRDPNRTRYLYSPSGFMLRQGEGYVSQTELLLTTFGLGLTDWLTMQVGTVLPVLFYAPSDLPVVVALKVGGSPSEYVHLAGGVQAFTVPAQVSGAYGFIFGTVTLGTEDLNLGISAGPPFAVGGGTAGLGALVVSVSGNWRVARSIALVSENWVIQADGSTHLIGSAAVRFIGERLGVDAGFLIVPGAGFPVPWLDFTWHFGSGTAR